MNSKIQNNYMGPINSI